MNFATRSGYSSPSEAWLTVALVLVLASAEGVAGITAGATLLAASGLALVTVYTKRVDVEHARELADLDNLRTLLDEAAIAIDRGADAVHRLRNEVSEHGVADLPVKERNRVAKRGRVIVSLLSRLHVRLGLTDPIVEHFDALSVAIWNAWQQANPLDADEPGELAKRFAAIRAAGKDFDDAADAFIGAAVARAGTVTMPKMRFRLVE
jgi:hypothetical protein